MMMIARIRMPEGGWRVVGEFVSFGEALKYLHAHHQAAFLADDWSIINRDAWERLTLGGVER